MVLNSAPVCGRTSLIIVSLTTLRYVFKRNLTAGMGEMTKRYLSLITIATILAAALVPTVADAATATSNLSVSVTITASCTIGTASLNFGNSVSGGSLLSSALPGSTTVSATCTSGTPYSIGMDNGANASAAQRRMSNGSGAYLAYDLYTDSGRTAAWTTATSSAACASSNSCYLGTGNGTAQSVSIYGNIPQQASAPAPGSYADTVTMTITY